MFDAVVVGAGPAGAMCSYHLAKYGLKVLLLEKKALPRFKLCAGCLSKRIEKHLPEGWERLILNEIRSGVLSYKGRSYRLESEETIAYIVDRASFDFFLSEKAQEMGAELANGEFYGFEKEGASYRVYTSLGTFKCDFIVGADGFYSKVAKQLGYKKTKFYRSLEYVDAAPWETDTVEISIGWVKRGYAWTFPKGDKVSVGITSTYRENLLPLLMGYRETGKKVWGWHIPFAEGERDLNIGRDRVLLVGDAGNFVDPLLGEGIYYSILSAQRLARAINESPSKPVELYRKLCQDLAEEFYYAGKIASLSYRFQWLAFRFGTFGGLELFYRLLKGELGYKELYRKGLLGILKIPFKIFLNARKKN